MSIPSPFLLRHVEALREASRRGPVVDLACGRGRNTLALAAAGVPVLGLDRHAGHLAELGEAARRRGLPVTRVQADLEAATHPPLRPGCCGAVVVARYLHRPLAQALVSLLAPGGWLLYETFTLDQRKLGYGPSNADFLLEPGELPRLFHALQQVEHWEGTDREGERPQALARLAARRPQAP